MKTKLTIKTIFAHPEYFLLILGGLVGLLFCFFIPYGAGFDETAHMIRVFDISHLSFLPNQPNDQVLAQFYMYSYQRRDFQSPAFDQFKKQTFFSKPVWDNLTSAVTLSTYFPANYLLPAIIGRIFWWDLHLPVLPVIILMRMAGFLLYLFACFLVLRMLPTGKWVFLVIAFTPMALFQAATITPDSFTLACSYLFIGVVLKVFFNSEKTISSSDAWKIAFVSVLVGCTKSGTILLLLLLLILIRLKPKSKSVLYIIFCGVLVSLVISIGWMLLVVVNSNMWTGQKTFMGQLQTVLTNLLDFLKIYLKGMFLSLQDYYSGWVGVYGYWVGKVPTVVYYLFPVALILGFVSDVKTREFQRKDRFKILIIGLICLVGIASFQFIAGYVPGVQKTDKVGRYFLPFSSLIFLAVSGWLENRVGVQKIARIFTIGLTIVTVGIYGFGIYRTYYTPCVYAVSPSQQCTLPIYKNLDLTNRYVATVTKKTVVNQSFTPMCSELASVQVRVQSTQAIGEDKVLFTLLDENQNRLFSQENLLSPLKQDMMLKMPVQQKVAVGKTKLWIRLSLPANDSDKADLGILGRKGGDIYEDGDLLFNQVPQDGDLFFQYTCSVP